MSAMLVSKESAHKTNAQKEAEQLHASLTSSSPPSTPKACQGEAEEAEDEEEAGVSIEKRALASISVGKDEVELAKSPVTGSVHSATLKGLVSSS